jgi:hypothetical protein
VYSHCTAKTGGSELNVSADCALQVSRPDGQQLSAAVDVQTVLLLGVNEVAATINRTTQMLAFNVSRWQPSAPGYASCKADARDLHGLRQLSLRSGQYIHVRGDLLSLQGICDS